MSGEGSHRALRRATELLADAGVQASVVVRDLDTHAELCLAPDRVHPLASVVKVPLALAVAERVERAEVHPGRLIALPADPRPVPFGHPGPAGTSAFRHTAVLAVQDLLHLAVSISDNRAADALFGLVPPRQVHEELLARGIHGFRIRHDTSPMTVEGLRDVSAENTATATAAADLLQELWRPQHTSPAAAGRVRGLMAASVHRQRLAPDLAGGRCRYASKTGTDGRYRHEVGVVEHAGGETLAVCVFSEAERDGAGHSPRIDAALGAAARLLHDALLDE